MTPVTIVSILSCSAHSIVCLDDKGRLWSGVMKFHIETYTYSINWSELPRPEAV